MQDDNIGAKNSIANIMTILPPRPLLFYETKLSQVKVFCNSR